MSDRAPSGREAAVSSLRERVGWLAAAIVVALPAFATRHLPMQDFPQHLAAIRILASLHDPTFAFDQDYAVAPGGSTYLLPYFVGAALTRLVGVWIAGKILVASYLVGTFLGVRALARANGGDGRVALLCVPLLVNPLFIIGLLPFLLATALLLWTLAASAAFTRSPSLRGGLILGALAIALALTHPIPFALFAMGHLSFVVASASGRRLAAFVPIAPAALLFTRFAFASNSGHMVRSILGAGGVGTRASIAGAARDLYGWIGDAFVDRSDEILVTVVLLVAVVSAVAGRRELTDRRRALALAFVPAAAMVLYFGGEVSHGNTWPLAPRMAILAALTVLPLVPIPRARPGRVVVLVAAATAVLAIGNCVRQFVAFEHETAGFDDTTARMRRRAHVAWLCFDGTSSVVRSVPYLHFGAYYQVDHGGVVKFSFAGYDHWPVDFIDGRYPPDGAPAAPGWEWHPERVSVEGELLPYFDYVIVRGTGFAPPPGTFVKTFASGRWELWEREPRP